MRDIPLIGFLSRCCHGFPLFFGGGASAPPSPPPPQAPVLADSEAAKQKSGRDAKRRIGGTDALQGNILGSLKSNSNLAGTLGGTAKAYTGEA